MWSDIEWINTLISILMALAVCGGVAILMDVLLLLASRYLSVKEDETVKEIRACLPGVNCGACGYKGCDDYAVAVAEGKAKPNLCVPGAETAASEIGEILGIEVEAPKDVKVFRQEVYEAIQAENKAAAKQSSDDALKNIFS